MGEDTRWHRRQALQIASQFPEDPEDAWAVLHCVEQLIHFFFEGPPSAPEPLSPGEASSVIRFSRRT
jgi:hypothetical protein